MKIYLKHSIVFILFISLLLLTGCWDQKEFEEIGFILQMGLELDAEGKLLLSTTSPAVSPDTKAKVEFHNISSEKLIRSSRERIRNVSGNFLQGGKIQHIYFSKDLASKGINEFFEIFFRNPENPLLANVVIIDGSPSEMMQLSKEYEINPKPAFYTAELLQDARRRLAVPETRIYTFSILNSSKTIDPVTPLIKYDKKELEIAGSALFSGDKMVGAIDTDQSILLNVLMGKKRGGEYIYKGQISNGIGAKIKKGAVLTFISSKRKIKMNTEKTRPLIDITLDFKALLDEYAGIDNFEDNETKKLLEEKISESIKVDTLKLLEYLQGVGADPIGFGEILRSKHPQYWKAVDWKDVYKSVDFNVEVNINIQSYGTIK